MEQAGKSILNTATFQNFHQDYVKLFYHFALRYIDDMEVVRDIVREAFIAVWQRMDEFREEEHVKAFIYKTIRNRSINYLRDRQVEQKNREKLWLLQDEEHFRNTAIEDEVYDYLCCKIEMLPPMQRKVLWLHVEGWTNEEIARELNISINTVLTHKQRARGILREYLDRYPHVLLLFLIYSL